MLWACCFVLFCFQTVGGEKKNQRVPRSRSWRHECSHPFFHSLPRAIQTQKAIQQQGWEHRGREGVTSPISPCISLFITCQCISHTPPPATLAPHPDCRFHDLYDIILSPSSPYIYSLVLFFNFSQTVIAIRLSL